MKRTHSISTGESQYLRKHYFDGREGFMDHGHQITTLGNRQRDRDIPEWTKHDEQIQKMLLRSFPKLRTNEDQRYKAGQWMRFIQLYWRRYSSRQIIMEEMMLTANQLKSLRSKIVRAGNGLPTDGRKKRGGPRGGDWKKRESHLQTPVVSLEELLQLEQRPECYGLQPGERHVPHSRVLKKLASKKSR